jgi:hypothetical protein
MSANSPPDHEARLRKVIVEHREELLGKMQTESKE